MQDLVHILSSVRGLSPVSITGSGTSSSQAVDRAGFDALMYLIQLGALNSIAATVVMEESATGSFGGEETAVADKDLLYLEASFAFTEADANKVGWIGYKGAKRYTRLKIVASAASGANLVAIGVVLGSPSKAPTTAPSFL